MAADNDVDATGVAGKNTVADKTRRIVSYVGEGNHGVDILAAAQHVGCGIGRGHDRPEIYAFAVVVAYHSFRVEIEAHYAYALSSVLTHGIRNQQRIQRSVVHIVVGAYELAVAEPQHRCQRVCAVVELVVAQYAFVESHDVQHLLLHPAAVEIEIQRTLHGVTGIDKHHIPVVASDAVDSSHAAHNPAEILPCGIDLRMGVVGVENNKSIVLAGGIAAAVKKS